MEQVKILVIDDDEDMTELLEMLLSPTSSCIIMANSGREGIELAKTGAPDVILFDPMVPGMNGLKVCQEIRAFSNAPILILSAINSPNVVAQALDSGADDYLVKPVSSTTLIARLNKLLRRTPLPSTLTISAHF